MWHCGAVTSLILLAFTSVPVFSNTIAFTGQPAIVYEGTKSAFTVTAPVGATVTNITFTFDGTPHNELSGVPFQPITFGTRTVDLVISNTPVSLDGVTVGCTAEVSTGEMLPCAPNVPLQVQGTLDAVGNLNSVFSAVDRTLNISWTAPPAITIPPATRPEIFYCVEINNGTATESIGCNRTGNMNEETSVTISDIVDEGNYDVIIIPFNRVGDGVNSTILFPDNPVIMPEEGIPRLLLSGNTVYTYPVSGLVCSCMATILDASVMGDLQCAPNASAGQITVTTNNVTTNRDFNIKIVATNSRGSAKRIEEITTYDAVELNATSSGTSELDYSVTFVQGTKALGVFMSILFRENGLTNFTKSVFFVQSEAGAAAFNQLMPLANGNYMTLVYDVEANGKISFKQPADQEMVAVTGPTECPTPMLMSLGATINCSSNLTTDASGVTVTCTFDVTLYGGYLTCIQNQMESFPSNCVLSKESGSMVTANGTINGEHVVFVSPIWISPISTNQTATAHREIYILTGVVTSTISNTEMTSTTSEEEMLASSSSSTATASALPSVAYSSTLLTIGVIIGVATCLN